MDPDTARKVLQVLGQILRHAEIDRLIARSPIIGIELPRSAAGDEIHFLSAAEIERLARCIDSRYRALIFTAACCGLRAGELGYLRVESLDLLRGTLEVCGSLAQPGHDLRFRAVSDLDAADDVHLPELHRPSPFPPLVIRTLPPPRLPR